MPVQGSSPHRACSPLSAGGVVLPGRGRGVLRIGLPTGLILSPLPLLVLLPLLPLLPLLVLRCRWVGEDGWLRETSRGERDSASVRESSFSRSTTSSYVSFAQMSPASSSSPPPTSPPNTRYRSHCASYTIVCPALPCGGSHPGAGGMKQLVTLIFCLLNPCTL